MWRKVLVTLGILCFLSCAKAQADDVYAYCPLGEGYVFLYDSPTGFQVIANLKCGAKLTVVDATDKDRVRVRTADGKEGYVVKSSINTPPSSAQRQPTPPPNSAAQQPQLPPPPTPVSLPQPQPQPKPQPEPKAQVQSVPPLPPTPQSDVQSQAQPQPPQAQPAQEQSKQPEPQVLPEPQPQAQPETPSQPQLEARSEPVTPIPPEPKPEKQPKPEKKPKPKAEAKPKSEPKAKAQPEPKSEPELKAEQRQSRTQQPAQPEPAATGFTPFSTLGYEQTIPRLELYGGYMFLNAGTSGLASRQNVSGVETSAAFHINRWLAGEADFGLGYKTLQILNVGTFPFHDYMAMAGPRFYVHKAFFHALVGIDHLAGSNNFYSITTTLADNSLAAAVGGGVQWNVSRRLALRTSGDYVLTRFEGLTQNNVRVTVGVVFELGSLNGGL